MWAAALQRIVDVSWYPAAHHGEGGLRLHRSELDVGCPGTTRRTANPP